MPEGLAVGPPGVHAGAELLAQAGRPKTVVAVDVGDEDCLDPGRVEAGDEIAASIEYVHERGDLGKGARFDGRDLCISLCLGTRRDLGGAEQTEAEQEREEPMHSPR